jgi:RNA polymerase sigma-70 factor (ECF subfamily)
LNLLANIALNTCGGGVNEGPEDSRSDEALIAAVNHGDTAAFEALYYRYRDWVVNLAFRFTNDREAALDVLQETFLYFSKKFPGFKLTARITTFLYPAVKNYSIAARRKSERYQAEIPALATPTDPVASGDLAALVACLPDDRREVLLLRFVDGFSLEEIATATKVPLGTVKSRLHYALKTLRESEATKKFFER